MKGESNMGAFVAQQPNGLYCRFSTIVDCPTHWNLTKEDYIQYRMNSLKEELEHMFKCNLKPFEWVNKYFQPVNMSKERFKEILEEMNKPVETSEDRAANKNNEQPMYYDNDAIDFIRSRSDLSEDVISKVLELELEYMKSIGLVYEIGKE